MTLQFAAEAFCLLATICGSVYVTLCAAAAHRFESKRHQDRASILPPATILKPLYGVDKNLLENLRTVCSQDYPEYQVVLSVQRSNDPAIAIMRQIEQEFGPERVTLAIADSETRANGKIQNLEIALSKARYDTLVVSDSDIRLTPDYLRAVTAPLADPAIGFVCTPYRAIHADKWFEKLELLTMNADFTPNLFFVSVAGLMNFGLGASMCFRRRDLDRIGGFSAFRDYLAEDAHMAAKFGALGLRMALIPHIVDMEVDLKSVGQWWSHQLYWDQNTRAINSVGYLGTAIIRSVPFALLFALLRGFDATGLSLLGGALAVRLATAGYILDRVLHDEEGLAALWLLPLRDVLGLAVWVRTMMKRDYIQRGRRFQLLADGRIVPKPAR